MGFKEDSQNPNLDSVKKLFTMYPNPDSLIKYPLDKMYSMTTMMNETAVCGGTSL